MKKFLILTSLAALAACTSNENATDAMESKGDSTAQTINSPYPIGYSSSFEMGDPKNAESVLAIWKSWDNGNLADSKDLFADSVEIHFADGTMAHSGVDSILASAQKYRDSYASVVSSVDAVMPAKSTDKNENWALIWGKEIDTDKSGKVDSFYLQETWRFNKDGKVDFFLQYKRQPNQPQ